MLGNIFLVGFGIVCMWAIGSTDMAQCKHKPCDCKECREKRRAKL